MRSTSSFNRHALYIQLLQYWWSHMPSQPSWCSSLLWLLFRRQWIRSPLLPKTKTEAKIQWSEVFSFGHKFATKRMPAGDCNSYSLFPLPPASSNADCLNLSYSVYVIVQMAYQNPRLSISHAGLPIFCIFTALFLNCSIQKLRGQLKLYIQIIWRQEH